MEKGSGCGGGLVCFADGEGDRGKYDWVNTHRVSLHRMPVVSSHLPFLAVYRGLYEYTLVSSFKILSNPDRL